jgi:hypothetical protein
MDSLAALSKKKKALSRRYLGHAGIHGLSTDPDRLVIRVFVEKSASEGVVAEALRKVAEQARPFAVEVVWSDAAQA